MTPGGVTTQAPGDTADMILDFKADAVAGSNLRMKVLPAGLYRGRNYAKYVNGIFTGEVTPAPLLEPFQAISSLTPGTQIGSVFIEDAGDWMDFDDDDDPSGSAELQDELTAQRVLVRWNTSYTQTAVDGDTQLSAITITGAKRGVNVAPDTFRATRGTLSYSITTTGTTRIVRWWADNTLVAEGSRTGDGVVTCEEINGSGLSIRCTLAYSADLQQGIATIQLRWPASYQIHYSTSALTFPRTPEATIKDNGATGYLYLTPVLAGGTYNYNVLTVDDEGVKQATSFIVTEPQTLRSAPASPTGLSVSGTAAALTVSWAVGEAGCTYTVYYSGINEPINFDDSAEPVPVTAAMDATNAVLPAITGYAATSTATALANVKTAFDAAVSDCNTVFAAGEAGFDDALETLIQALSDALDTYEEAIQINLADTFLDVIEQSTEIVINQNDALADFSLTTTQWQNFVGPYYGNVLALLGVILTGDSGRYSFPNGAAPGVALPGDTTGLGTAPDGSTSALELPVGVTLAACAEPQTRPGQIRIAVRTTKNGVQECGDRQLIVTFDNAGAIVRAFPNQPQIQRVTVTGGLTVSVTAAVLEDDPETTSNGVALFIQSGTINTASIQDAQSLSTAVAGYRTSSLSYAVAAAGYYNIAVLSPNADGAYPSSFNFIRVYIANDTPNAVQDLTAQVVRGRQSSNGE